METLHPNVQITLIIVGGLFACVLILSLFTTFFDNFNRKK
jgi:hypothetical protein